MFLQVRYQHMAKELIVVTQSVRRRNENQLGSVQGFRHGERDAVGVGPVCLPIATKAEGRHDGNNALVQQALQEFRVDTFDLPGKQVVNAMDDPKRMGNDGICIRGAEIVSRQPAKDLGREMVCGVYG